MKYLVLYTCGIIATLACAYGRYIDTIDVFPCRDQITLYATSFAYPQAQQLTYYATSLAYPQAQQLTYYAPSLAYPQAQQQRLT